MEGQYRYRKGVNPRALWALALGVLPVVPGFFRAAVTAGGQVANPNVLDTLYTYAWFVTFALSFGLYLVFSRSALRRLALDATHKVAAHS
jgi:NCS1 family nucleobase:cation symporter-1